MLNKYCYNIYDTGSAESQIIFINIKIRKLIFHLSKNKNDKNSKKNLIILKNKKVKLLNYLKKKKIKIYYLFIKDLNLDNIDMVER